MARVKDLKCPFLPVMAYVCAWSGTQPAFAVLHPVQLKNRSFRKLVFLTSWPLTMITQAMRQQQPKLPTRPHHSSWSTPAEPQERTAPEDCNFEKTHPPGHNSCVITPPPPNAGHGNCCFLPGELLDPSEAFLDSSFASPLVGDGVTNFQHTHLGVPLTHAIADLFAIFQPCQDLFNSCHLSLPLLLGQWRGICFGLRLSRMP